jgi:histidine triad (HIT) family protein
MQISHAPDGYDCPFCRVVAGESTERSDPSHVVARYDEVLVVMNPRWWENNQGNVLVIPNRHYENIFDLPIEMAGPLHTAARDAAVAMKSSLGCHGISTRQHNEPAGNQEMWHYHLHVFPRWEGDDLYKSSGYWAPAAELAEMTERLRSAWPAEGAL